MFFINSDTAKINFDKNTPFITFPVLSELPFLCHGFSTRLGGVSSGIFSTLNLSFKVGEYEDDPDMVKENYKRIANSIGVAPESIVISKQVHKTNIRLVDDQDCGKGLWRERDFDEIDGMITNTPGVTLATTYADCVPLYLVDPKNKVIGLTHSGWRGTVKKIGKRTVEAMEKEFHSDPKDIIAVIGPSICMDCFEIGEEVAMEFINAFSLIEPNSMLRKKENGKYHCDLWYANQRVFLEAGLTPDHIYISNVCTSCNSELLFSHRKTAGKRGSLAAFLSIQNQS
ncbi:MAG: hypothetical protein K0S47_1720 [Herbinix sp.]|jgi:YfiH family protein|nr:hypothetical protein [Herbinix sp.]